MPKLIDVVRYGEGFKAFVRESPEIWGYGVSNQDAVGSLVAGHYNFFGVAFQWSNGGKSANHPESISKLEGRA